MITEKFTGKVIRLKIESGILCDLTTGKIRFHTNWFPRLSGRESFVLFAFICRITMKATEKMSCFFNSDRNNRRTPEN